MPASTRHPTKWRLVLSKSPTTSSIRTRRCASPPHGLIQRRCAWARLPKAKGGAGSTVFWNTGAVLFKYGQNKEKAAEYLTKLTRDAKIWQDLIAGTAAAHPGQLPPYKSIYDGWAKDNPDWLKAQPWVPLVRGQLDVAKAIPNHAFGLSQFQIGQPLWEKFLTGEEADPMVALQAAKDAVVAEIKKTS